MHTELTADRPCDLTGSRDALEVATTDRHGQPLRTVISKNSGLVYVDPRPTPEQVRQFYAKDYRESYKGTATPKRKHILRAGRVAQARYEVCRKWLAPSSRMLDIGSGGGEFVYLCSRHGHASHGIEPNEGYAQFSIEQYDIDVQNGFYQDATYEAGSFDCVTLFHVLEHLEEPVAALSQLGEFLRPGGRLCVEVPNVDYTRTAPNQKWHIGHLFHFNPQTLTAVGAKAGLTPLSTTVGGDGGILFAVFEKPEQPHTPNLNAILAGSFEQTFGILSHHTQLTHYLKPHIPLGRLLAKVRRTFDERSHVKQYRRQRPISILDGLASGQIQ